MTILTKPSDKKVEKVPLPLSDEVSMLHSGAGVGYERQSPYNPDHDAESMVFNRSPNHFTCLKTLILFLVAVGVMLMGLLGGYTLYRMYAPNHSGMHYKALCDIPYSLQNNMSLPRFYARPDDLNNWRNLLPLFENDDSFDDMLGDNFFREEIELDMTDDESYAKINVPDFRDGRRGRFMHDFKENQSAIIDTTANRCFIMSLDRDTTMPPKSFMDLMQKMGSGYYNIDTDRVRKNMRVVMPPITDLSTISERIANECYDMKVYMLESFVSGVSKREAKPISEGGKFAEFLGKGIVEFNIMNIADIEEFEKTHQQKK